MSERISPPHLKQFVGRLIEDDSVRTEVLALIDRHLAAVKDDKQALVEGLELLLADPDDGRQNALTLIERFGKMPQIVYSRGTDD